MAGIDKANLRKEVVGPFTGQHFTIRRVRFKTFMLSLGGLPLPVAATVQEALKSLNERVQGGDTNTEDKITQFYAEKGVVEPKIWFGPEENCPDGQIFFEDLGSDLDYLVSEVIGYSHELAGAKEFEKFFRGSGAGAPGPDGEEVRAETVKAPPEGDVPI